MDIRNERNLGHDLCLGKLLFLMVCILSHFPSLVSDKHFLCLIPVKFRSFLDLASITKYYFPHIWQAMSQSIYSFIIIYMSLKRYISSAKIKMLLLKEHLVSLLTLQTQHECLVHNSRHCQVWRKTALTKNNFPVLESYKISCNISKILLQKSLCSSQLKCLCNLEKKTRLCYG